MKSIRKRIEQIREERQDAQQRLDELEAQAKRRAARQAKQQQAQADEETVIHNTATIAGNVANHVVVHHPHCG